MKEYQKQVDDWIQKFGVRYFDVKTNGLLLAEEVGELARILARTHGEQSFKSAEEASTALSDLEEEMADVLFVLCCLANQLGVDLENAFNAKMLKKTTRDRMRHSENEKLNDTQ